MKNDTGGVPLGGSEAVIKTALTLGREAALEYDVTLDEGIGQCIESGVLPTG